MISVKRLLTEIANRTGCSHAFILEVLDERMIEEYYSATITPDPVSYDFHPNSTYSNVGLTIPVFDEVFDGISYADFNLYDDSDGKGNDIVGIGLPAPIGLYVPVFDEVFDGLSYINFNLYDDYDYVIEDKVVAGTATSVFLTK